MLEPDPNLPATDARPGKPQTRRTFLKTVGAGGLTLTAYSVWGMPGGPAETQEEAPPEKIQPISLDDATRVELNLTINKKSHTLRVDPRITLLDLLTEQLAMMGTKKGCDHGQCGACTILANGRAINSCLALAVTYNGTELTTIEGLANGAELHPVQSAVVQHDAFQCGYCTPGQIMSAAGLLKRGKKYSAGEIRECMSGNICRCGAYPNIVAAVLAAQTTLAQNVSAPRGDGNGEDKR